MKINFSVEDVTALTGVILSETRSNEKAIQEYAGKPDSKEFIDGLKEDIKIMDSIQAKFLKSNYDFTPDEVALSLQILESENDTLKKRIARYENESGMAYSVQSYKRQVKNNESAIKALRGK